MAPPDPIDRRTERAAFETDRQLIVGDVTLPASGYQARFSDSLNRQIEFIPLVNVEVTSLADGKVVEHPFALVNKSQVRFAYPVRG